MKAKVILILLMGFSPLIYGQTKTNASQQSVSSYSQSSTTRVNSQPSSNANYVNSHNVSTSTNASPNYSHVNSNNYRPGYVNSTNTHVANHSSINQQPVSNVYTLNTDKENMSLSRRDFSNIRQIVRNSSLSRSSRTEKPAPANCTDAAGLEECVHVALDAGNVPHPIDPIDLSALENYLHHRDTKQPITSHSAYTSDDMFNKRCTIYAWRLSGRMNCYAFMFDVGFTSLDSCNLFSAMIRTKYHCPVYYYYDSTDLKNKKYHNTYAIEKCDVLGSLNYNEVLIGDVHDFDLQYDIVKYDLLYERCRCFRNSYR